MIFSSLVKQLCFKCFYFFLIFCKTIGWERVLLKHQSEHSWMTMAHRSVQKPTGFSQMLFFILEISPFLFSPRKQYNSRRKCWQLISDSNFFFLIISPSGCSECLVEFFSSLKMKIIIILRHSDIHCCSKEHCAQFNSVPEVLNILFQFPITS